MSVIPSYSNDDEVGHNETYSSGNEYWDDE